jgi:hypothetical protein
MPVALIAISVLVMLGATTPSEASQSCMSKKAGSAHINWEGPARCRGATPHGRNPQIKKAARTIEVHEVEEHSDQPHGNSTENIEPSQQVSHSVGAGQAATPPIIERSPGRKVTLPGMTLVFIVIALTLSTIEVLFRCTVKEER